MGPDTATRSILAVTGLRVEARIAHAPGVITLAGGGDSERLADALDAALASGVTAVISFGIAGGLAPHRPPGTIMLPVAVSDGNNRWSADAAWHRFLAAALPGAVHGCIHGADAAVESSEAKADLHRRFAVTAVDMESHVVARLASKHAVPFAVLRVIGDPAERTLPSAALVGMRPDGTIDAVAVLRALVRRPGDFPALMRTARDARVAQTALKTARRNLPADFAFEASARNGGGAGLPR